MKTKHVLVALSPAVDIVQPVLAQNLPEDFVLALTLDPSFQSAKADSEVGQRNIKQAKSVFFPEANFNIQRLTTDTGSRTTFTITQPLLDAQRWMTLGQAAPQKLLAEVNLQGKRLDLAVRLLKAANAIILANESIRLNTAKMESLDQQAQAAKLKLRLWQGTVTDLRDIEVRANQAKAQQLSFRTQLQNALKAYEAITGVLPPRRGLCAAHHPRQLQHPPPAGLHPSGFAIGAQRAGRPLQRADCRVRGQKNQGQFSARRDSAVLLFVHLSHHHFQQLCGRGPERTLEGGHPLQRERGRSQRGQGPRNSARDRVQSSPGVRPPGGLGHQRHGSPAHPARSYCRRRAERGGHPPKLHRWCAHSGGCDQLYPDGFSGQVRILLLGHRQSVNILNLILLAATEPQDTVTETYRYLFAK
jgi:hypothetical protein